MKNRTFNLVFCFAALLACAAAQPTPDAVAWMAEAARVNRAADAALARGEREAAYSALVAFVQRPGARDVAGDRRAVLMDAYFRLGELALSAKNAPAALLWSDHGLALGKANDLFTANLLIVKGHAAEALGDDTLASESFHKALVINDTLLSVTLGDSAR